jgi:AcrR family transcriptional regulator
MAATLLHRKESVVLTAIEIIDRLGIQGLSTREIARRQNISEGTLFRHFKTKNDIILAVLDYFSQYDSDIFQSVALKGLSVKEAIVFFVDTYVTYYENYPAITAMTQIFDVLSREPYFAAKITRILSNRLNFLRGLIEEGQKTGQIQPDIDSDGLADIITGTCTTICLRWRMSDHRFPLRERTLSALEMILKAFGLPEA